MKETTVSGDVMREYVRVRRKHFGYTQKTFAEVLDVPLSTYRDFESGDTDQMRAGLFARVVDKLKVPLEHVRRLGSDLLSKEEAAGLAVQALKSDQVAAIDTRGDEDAKAMTDAQLDHMLSMFDEFKNDPLRYGEWLGYGRRLLEETAADPVPDKEQRRKQQ